MELRIEPGDFSSEPSKMAGLSISAIVRQWAAVQPLAPAFITPSSRSSWSDYNDCADLIASALTQTDQSNPVAIYLPDTMIFHAALCGAFRAGRVSVGIGARSGIAEVAHLMDQANCRSLITNREVVDGADGNWLSRLWNLGAEPRTVIIADETGDVEIRVTTRDGYDQIVFNKDWFAPMGEPFTIDDISMLNCTSGTTGLPKLVCQHEARWIEFSKHAVLAGHLTGADIVCGVIPAPFGFGLWTSHFAPAFLGVPTVCMERFSVDTMIELLDLERVTVLACVSTQFKMLLRSEMAAKADLGSLRVMFSGGEAVPFSEALAFEKRTGAAVLQFYGSNESGAVSYTTVDDDPEVRLKTCGHVIEEMNVKVFDDEGNEVKGRIRRGQPGVFGPLMSKGYWNDDEANRELRSPEGWVLLGDVVEIDETGLVRVVGRKADIIIRGGKNISAVEVEEKISSHPLVAMVSVVGITDAIFGEKVCAVIVPQDGKVLTLSELVAWLADQGITPEYFPEFVITTDRLPTGSGGKIAKGEVRLFAEQRIRGLDDIGGEQ